MKKVTKKILLLILTIMPLQSIAAGWTQFLPVTEVYTYSTGDVFLILDGPAANTDGCEAPHQIKVLAAQANSDKIYQMALTAKASGKKVSAYLSGCVGTGPRVYHLRLRD